MKEKQKNKYQEWGKLGGRPEKDIKRNNVISFRLTNEEFQNIQKKADSHNLSFSSYCRLVLTDKTLPNVEQNKLLISYATNFSRISNFMKMGIFNSEEKKRLINEIEILIKQFRENIKW